MNEDWIEVASTDEIPPGGMKRVEIAGQRYLRHYGDTGSGQSDRVSIRRDRSRGLRRHRVVPFSGLAVSAGHPRLFAGLRHGHGGALGNRPGAGRRWMSCTTPWIPPKL